MFDFLRRSHVRDLSDGVRRAFAADGLPTGTDVSALRVVESRGTFAGRKVSYFSVFDPMRAAAFGVDILAKRQDQDLAAFPGVVLCSGFIEQDGAVVLYARSSALDAAVPPGASEPGRARG